MLCATLALLVTGCPHNEYIVQLQPDGDHVLRTLEFYCCDGVNTNTGKPNYENFSPDELAAIAAMYPAGDITNAGKQYFAQGEFTNTLPPDVGGAGACMSYVTTLGATGIYSERFRGNDDMAGLATRRMHAADQLTDLLLGWSKAELAKEPGYDQLRGFIDKDFRQDLKNLGAYWWEGQLVTSYQTNAYEEFIARFCQYAWERGYFKVGDIPVMYEALNSGDAKPMFAHWQRFVAAKIGVPETNSVPASLGFLSDEKTMEASFTNYLAGTEAYRVKLQQWAAQANLNPTAQAPQPSSVTDDLLGELIEFDLFGHNDHLTVKLALTAPPLRTNGRWDETLKQVIWETDMGARTNAAHLPFACFATWVQPGDNFQTNHFGGTILTGDALLEYCLWRNSLDAARGAEWDAFIAGLQPGGELAGKVSAFRFLGEPAPLGTNQEASAISPSAKPRELLGTALQAVKPGE